MKPEGKKSINIDLQFWKELQRAKADTGKALHVLMAEAWKARGQQPSVPKTEQVPHAPTKHRKWQKMLESILDSGHKIAIDAVTENLIAFDRLVKVDPPEASPDFKDKRRAS